jgi:hypothetical protein
MVAGSGALSPNGLIGMDTYIDHRWDGDRRMKLFPFALSVIALAAVFPSAVEAQSYPWCAITDLGDVVENCYFDSFEQCTASLGGTHDFCRKNKYQPPPPESVSAAPAQAAAAAAPVKKPKVHSTLRPS